MNTIPLVDLKAQYKSIKKEIDFAIKNIIRKTNFIMGDEIQIFEKQFSQFIQVKFAVGVSSGTDALHLSLKALNIKKGDEIILPSHTFTATAEVIVWLGAKPVFVDILEDYYTIDPEKVNKVINNKTKAIIPVHLYGQPSDLASLIKISTRNNIAILEDCAQAHGAEYKGKKVGGFGEFGAFSFYPGKNLGAYGDAGIVTTNNDDLYRKVLLLRNHGRIEKYTHEIVGYGNRLDTLQAAILTVKLKHLFKWNQKRIKNAMYFKKELESVGDLVLPMDQKENKSVYHLFVIRTKRRDDLRSYLQKNNIETGIHYPLPLHLQPAYSSLGYKKGDLPVTEKIAKEILSLPLYPELTQNQIQYICTCIKNYFR